MARALSDTKFCLVAGNQSEPLLRIESSGSPLNLLQNNQLPRLDASTGVLLKDFWIGCGGGCGRSGVMDL